MYPLIILHHIPPGLTHQPPLNLFFPPMVLFGGGGVGEHMVLWWCWRLAVVSVSDKEEQVTRNHTTRTTPQTTTRRTTPSLHNDRRCAPTVRTTCHTQEGGRAEVCVGGRVSVSVIISDCVMVRLPRDQAPGRSSILV